MSMTTPQLAKAARRSGFVARAAAAALQLATLGMATFGAGCSLITPPTTVHQPMTARPAPVNESHANAGAIYQAESARLVLNEDRRARFVGDTITMKNGGVYRGVIDRDNTIVWIFDGLKRTVVRDSKIARIEPDASYRNMEWFKIEQPLVVHGGSMPKEVLAVKAEPW